MIAASGQVTTGYWPAVMIGIVLLVIAIVSLIGARRTAVKRARRWRRDVKVAAPVESLPEADIPYERCRGLIAEALIVRDRVSGQIDAATYQARMKDLVSGRRS